MKWTMNILSFNRQQTCHSLPNPAKTKVRYLFSIARSWLDPTILNGFCWPDQSSNQLVIKLWANFLFILGHVCVWATKKELNPLWYISCLVFIVKCLCCSWESVKCLLLGGAKFITALGVIGGGVKNRCVKIHFQPSTLSETRLSSRKTEVVHLYLAVLFWAEGSYSLTNNAIVNLVFFH